MEGGVPRFGIKVVSADLIDPTGLSATITRRPRLIDIEMLVNPRSDVLDSAFASPALQWLIKPGGSLRRGFEGARRFVYGLSLFGLAASLGDAEALVLHPASLLRPRTSVRPEADLLDDLRRGLAMAS